MWWCFFAAQAGTLSFHAASPVGLKLDAEWVTHAATDTTVSDIAPGVHRVEVCDLLGRTIAFEDVRFDEGPVRLVYEGKVLTRVATDVEDPAPPQERPRIPRDAMNALQRDLLTAAPRRRMDRLQAGMGDVWFAIQDIDALVGAFDDLQERFDAVRLLSGRTLDPQNASRLEHHFPDEARQQAVVALFDAE